MAEGTDDADRSVAEVHRHRRALLSHHASEPVGLVADPVVELELVDLRLGLRLEGTAGKVAPRSTGSSCHHRQYALSMAMRVTLCRSECLSVASRGKNDLVSCAATPETTTRLSART